MEFTSVARAIRRHWVVVLITFSVVVAMGVFAAYSPPDRYKASAVVLVEPDPSKQQLQFQIVSLITPTLVARLDSRSFHDAARERISDAALRDAPVSVQAIDDGTGVLRVVAASTNRRAVAPWATAFADELVAAPVGEGFVTMSLLDTAITPSKPYAPARRPIVVSAVLLGLIAAVLSAIAAAAYRRRLDEANEIRSRFGTSVLGEVPAMRRVGAHALEAMLGPKAPPQVVEAVQSLRTNVEFVLAGRRRRSVAVVSAASGEGKSTVAAMLAWSLGAAGVPTTLIDADLRRPTLHRYLGLNLAPGLSSVILQRPLESLLQRTRQPRLSFLAAGVPDRHPAEILPVTVPQVLQELAESTVVIDCPPFDGFAETAFLTSMVETVILVIDWRRRDLVDVERSLAALQERGAEVLGVVINRSKRKAPAGKYYYSAVDESTDSVGTPSAERTTSAANPRSRSR